MTRSDLCAVAFNLVNLLDAGISAPLQDGRDAATDGRALEWLSSLAPGAPATDWTLFDDVRRVEIDRAIHDIAVSLKPSKVGAVENGVAAILGYTIQLLHDS